YLIVDLKLCNRTNYAVKLYKEGNMTVNQICEITNVSRASLYRKLSEVNN
ncbi:TPA: helix-turn-helix domain-containing protein, partial [Enterococcus faecium]|nr:helix-turn-helix domain-containing protein [Enterococcus faecium]HAP6132916.1 helix-turn-helix domain-containing protein [Enterococcus faecium]HAP6138536.1 helix-turn-helix domain-containing protein [Enterococcus faecium]HAP6147282.1 helix-turn-helix domain-containing protein [Enterococcus faecium]HAP6353069.1 helix-turn-helix domain-containing protein [Enterococcus faecium]